MGRLGIILFASLIALNTNAGLESCKNLSKQVDLNTCASSALKESNNKFNKVYVGYLRELSPNEQTMLKNSQRLWVQFRDKDCEFESSPVKNGSMFTYVNSVCLIEKADKRILELSNMSDCKKGTEPSCI
ncbi:hypothetical protein D3C78_185170 [compost metagenome]|jgi:uncharacterized protein YecT (DUF1311 family)